MRRLLLILTVLGLCFSGPAVGQNNSALIVEQLAGEWVSDGDAFGVPAKTTMRWGRTLGGKFFRLDYQIEMQSDAGEPSVFAGVAYYRHAGNDTYAAYWADTGGELHPIKAERAGKALIAHWGTEGKKQGRTRYQIHPDGTVEVTDWIKTDEGWHQFNQNLFRAAASSE